MERISWAVILLIAVGTAALVLAFAPSAWPNPIVADGKVVEAKAVPELESAVMRVDAACRRGDEGAFAQLTTASYRRDLEVRLQAVDATLDAATLRRMSRGGSGYADWLRRPVLAMHAMRGYVAVAVDRGRNAKGESDGAQVLVFEWDGEQFMLDGVRHAPRVATEEAAGRFLVELLRLR
ncbi:MAG: hypothetical protein KAI24_21545 [Planctomycetes bacterium]|nr:hypothetical protein [Planctomycetota bacterium]